MLTLLSEKIWLVYSFLVLNHTFPYFQVSTAIRLCDGALVIVDVVEGVCPQVYKIML